MQYPIKSEMCGCHSRTSHAVLLLFCYQFFRYTFILLNLGVMAQAAQREACGSESEAH